MDKRLLLDNENIKDSVCKVWPDGSEHPYDLILTNQRLIWLISSRFIRLEGPTTPFFWFYELKDLNTITIEKESYVRYQIGDSTEKYIFIKKPPFLNKFKWENLSDEEKYQVHRIHGALSCVVRDSSDVVNGVLEKGEVVKYRSSYGHDVRAIGVFEKQGHLSQLIQETRICITDKNLILYRISQGWRAEKKNLRHRMNEFMNNQKTSTYLLGGPQLEWSKTPLDSIKVSHERRGLLGKDRTINIETPDNNVVIVVPPHERADIERAKINSALADGNRLMSLTSDRIKRAE